MTELSKCHGSVEVIPCATAAAFLDVLMPWREGWTGVARSEGELVWESNYWFRGQSTDWPLVPSAMRAGSFARSADLGRALVSRFPAPRGAVLGAKHQFLMEYTALEMFLKSADDQGLLVPGDSLAARNAVLLALTGDVARKWPSDAYVQIAAIAQHHGVPTRLLDWSTSSLVAAFFAAEKDPEHGDSCVVWGQDIGLAKTRFEDPPRGIEAMRVPRAGNPNLVSQQGVFTMVRGATVPPLEAMDWSAPAGRTTLRAPLVKVTLPAEQRGAVLQALARLGLHASTIYAGGDAVGRRVVGAL